MRIAYTMRAKQDNSQFDYCQIENCWADSRAAVITNIELKELHTRLIRAEISAKSPARKTVTTEAAGYNAFSSLSIAVLILLKVTSLPRISAISVAPPGVTGRPDNAIRNGQIRDPALQFCSTAAALIFS